MKLSPSLLMQVQVREKSGGELDLHTLEHDNVFHGLLASTTLIEPTKTSVRRNKVEVQVREKRDAGKRENESLSSLEKVAG